MDDLYTELQEKRRKLDESVKLLRKTGSDYAQAEHDYKVLLRTECLKLRDEGMPIGLIDKTCYGIPNVAKLRLARDIAETVWKANQEAIQTLKLQIRLIESQISREWGQAK